MNLHEYQGKQLFAEYGLPVSTGFVCSTPQEAVDAAAKMAEYGLREERGRMETLNEKLVATRAGLRVLVPKLFRIHPDDLVV